MKCILSVCFWILMFFGTTVSAAQTALDRFIAEPEPRRRRYTRTAFTALIAALFIRRISFT